jgi:hypothetical protein
VKACCSIYLRFWSHSVSWYFNVSTDYAMRLFSARKSREALFSPWVYATTFFGIVDFMTIAPWYFQMILISTGHISGDEAKVL